MEDKILAKNNLIILAVALVLLVLGYVFLGQGPVYNHLSWSVAPILLVTAYCVVIPVAILYGWKKKK